MSNTIKLVLATTVLTASQLASAGPFSSGVIYNCSEIANGDPTTIACAGLELGEHGCPISYFPDGHLCLANDSNAEHPKVIRNTCDDDAEMVGTKCVRADIPNGSITGK
jgi:hypothetical protein